MSKNDKNSKKVNFNDASPYSSTNNSLLHANLPKPTSASTPTPPKTTNSKPAPKK